MGARVVEAARLNRDGRHALLAIVGLAVVFAGIAAWSWSWPDSPLIPDEAIGKVMTDSVAEGGTPFAREPFTEYPNGAFVVESYRDSYTNHTLERPPVSVATAYEQGLFGAKLGRAITLGVGFTALAFLAWRLDGPTTAFLAGVLYVSHPAVLYFHQSYFANPGGTAWLLAFLALLEASRERAWLGPAAVAAAGVTLVYRIELGIALLVAGLLAPFLGPLRSPRSLLAFYVPLALALAAFWIAVERFPSYVLLADSVDVRDAILHPVTAIRDRMDGFLQRQVVEDYGDLAFKQNVSDYFLWFFPLVTSLALVGLAVKPRHGRASWFLAPLALQSVVMAYAILPALVNFDFWEVSWLESSIVRYFLPLYAVTAVLAALALSAALRATPKRFPRAAPVAAVALAGLLVATNVVQAIEADHGVRWANERRAWFTDISREAEALGERAVFIGVQPSKIVFERPVLSPQNVGFNDGVIAKIAVNLTARGYAVYALDPWFYADGGLPGKPPHSVAHSVLVSSHAYWTDTNVTVPCACGESAHFWRMRTTNATLAGVERLAVGAFEESSSGLRSSDARALFWSDRAILDQMAGGRAPKTIVRVEYLDDANGTLHKAGYVNVPVSVRANEHVLGTWRTTGSGEWRIVTFEIPARAIVNGPLFVTQDLTIRTLEVKPVP